MTRHPTYSSLTTLFVILNSASPRGVAACDLAHHPADPGSILSRVTIIFSRSNSIVLHTLSTRRTEGSIPRQSVSFFQFILFYLKKIG